MSNSKNSESVKVVVRCRPMTEKEQAAKFKNVVSVDVKLGQIIVKNPRESSASERHKVFTFDSVYDSNSKQIDLYNETFRPLVDSVLHGFNGTIFAYGQTGTGKTYTMEGVREDPERRGVIPNSFEHIFTHISQSQNQQYQVTASYLEIYQDEIRDLLSQDQSCNLDLRESPGRGICVKNLSSVTTRNVQEIENIMRTGNQNRSVGATNMNEHSSRSHAIFLITVECREVFVDGENCIRVGKLNLVDLAGSERQAKTGDHRERLKEATKINMSLFALGNVISALVDDRSSHIPYRDSKITRLLQDSLGGNARTVMVANIGPASYNVEETLMTLQYSHRAKHIKNKPSINEDPKGARIRECQEELAKLKAQLQMRMGKKKRRRRVGEGGGGEEGGEMENNDEDEDGDGVDEGDYLREEQEKVEMVRKAIIKDYSLVAEEKAWLLEEKEKKMKDFKREREVRDKLAARLKEIKSRIMLGGGYIMDHTNEQQIMLKQRRHEIAEQTRREREMAQQVENSDEETLEEVEIKTKKLNELWAKLQEVKAEICDVQEGSSNERQELGLYLYELTKEINRKQFIIDNFIPEEKKNRLLNRAYFDEKDGLWKLRPILDYWMMTRCLTTRRRPNIRGKNENILKLKLDMPERTTDDYQPPSINPVMAAILKDALWDEEEIVIDASDLDSSSGLTLHASTSNNLNKPESGRPKTGKKSRATTSQSSSSSSGARFYPKCRGLVPK